MGARRTINRGETLPHGRDFDEVLRKGKAFHRISGCFEMSPYDYGNGILWCAERETIGPCTAPKGTRKFIFNKKTARWEETSAPESSD